MLFWIFDWRHQIRIREIVQLNSNNCSSETPVQVFSSKFWYIFNNPYLQIISERQLLDFFIHLIVFDSQLTNRNPGFFYFSTCLVMAFERDEYHELCIWKTLPWETNDPVVVAWEIPYGTMHFSEISRGIKRCLLGWLIN